MQIIPNLYLEKELVSLSDSEIAYLTKFISDIFLVINSGHDPRNAIWTTWYA